MRRLVGYIYTRWKDRNAKVLLIDFKGNPLWVEKDLVIKAAEAEILDAARTFDKGALVWQHEPIWHFDIQGMRTIIATAQHYDDVETALIAIASSTWLED